MQISTNSLGVFINQNISVGDQRRRAALIAIAQGKSFFSLKITLFPSNDNIFKVIGELQIPPNIVRDPPNQNIPVINQRRRAVLLAIAEGKSFCSLKIIIFPLNDNIFKVVAGMQVSPNVTGVPPNRNIPAINQRHTPDNANAQGKYRLVH